jgi:hypothetical protein
VISIMSTNTDKTGLTLEQMITAIGPEIPTDLLGKTFERLPERNSDRKLRLFRPLAVPTLTGLSAMEPGAAAAAAILADMIELVSMDPQPTHTAWTDLPGGGRLNITKLIDGARRELTKPAAAR